MLLLFTPILHVWTLLYFDRLNRWFHVICVKNGAWMAVAGETVTVTVTLCDRLPLVPVTFTR